MITTMIDFQLTIVDIIKIIAEHSNDANNRQIIIVMITITTMEKNLLPILIRKKPRTSIFFFLKSIYPFFFFHLYTECRLSS